MCLEENFAFSLPENGTIIFDSFISTGFDYEEYAVIKYSDLSALEKYEWITLTEDNISEILSVLENHDAKRTSDNKEPIPKEYMPDYTRVKGIRLNDPPNEDGFYNERKFAYVLIDAEKLYVYAVIYCP